MKCSAQRKREGPKGRKRRRGQHPKAETPVRQKKTPSKSRGKSKSAKKKLRHKKVPPQQKMLPQNMPYLYFSWLDRLQRSAQQLNDYKHQHGKVFTIPYWPSSNYSARCISNIAPIYGNGIFGYGIALRVYPVIALGTNKHYDITEDIVF